MGNWFTFPWFGRERKLVIVTAKQDKERLAERFCCKIYEHETDKDLWVLPETEWDAIHIGDVYKMSWGSLVRQGTLKEYLDSDDETNAYLLDQLDVIEARHTEQHFSMMSRNVRHISGETSVQAEFPGASANITSAFKFTKADEAVFKGTDVEIKRYSRIPPLEALMTREHNASRLRDCFVVSYVKIIHGDCTALYSESKTAHALLDMSATAPVGAPSIAAGAAFGGQYLSSSEGVGVKNFPGGTPKATRAILHRLAWENARPVPQPAVPTNTLKGHTRYVEFCAIFKNDTRAISCSGDTTLKVWNLISKKELLTLGGHTSAVYCCAVFDQDTRVISGSLDQTLKVWDLSNGKELFSLPGHTKGIWCCKVFANGTQVVSGSKDETLKVWDLDNRKELFTLSGHSDAVTDCAVFADDKRILSASEDRTMKVWDLTSRKVLYTLQGHTDYVTCCALFASDTRVISGSRDNDLKVWELENGRELLTLQGHKNFVRCCAVYASDSRVISGSRDYTLKVWNLETGEELDTLEGHKGTVNSCAVYANGTRIITGSHYSGTIKLWELPSVQ